MPGVEIRSDSPVRLVPLCGFWLAATIVHFVVCAELGYYYGRLLDVEVPSWLRSLDQVLFYSLSIAAEFFVLLVWWVVVGLAAWPLCIVVGRSAKWLFGVAGSAAARHAAGWMWPTMAFSLLSLFLFPVVAPRHTESPTALDIASITTPQAFGYYTILGLHCLLGVALMFVVLAAIVAWFDAQWRAAGWGFFIGLALGVAACGAFCAGLSPAMDAMFDRIGLLGSAAVYLTLVAVVTVAPQVWPRQANRRRSGVAA